MRVTIHMVSRREYWAYALGVAPARRDQWRSDVRADRPGAGEADLAAAADRLRARLADGPQDREGARRHGDGLRRHPRALGRSRPRAPGGHMGATARRPDSALADEWVGPPDATEADGLTHLVSAYLRAFGPAAVAATSRRGPASTPTGGQGSGERSRAGSAIATRQGASSSTCRVRRCRIADMPAPVRFLPHWDANLLVHARRTGLLPEAVPAAGLPTRNPFSVGTYLVDGVVAGAWSFATAASCSTLPGGPRGRSSAHRAGARGARGVPRLRGVTWDPARRRASAAPGEGAGTHPRASGPGRTARAAASDGASGP